MKKVLILFCTGMMLLASCGPRDYEGVKKDAKECVIEFLQAVKDGDDKKGNDLHGHTIVSSRDRYEDARQYNPDWEPMQVSFREDVDTITNDYGYLAYVLVHASYKGKPAIFKVSFSGETGKEGEPVVLNYKDFIRFNFEKYKSDHGFDIEKGDMWDDAFLSWVEKIPNVTQTVNNYIASISAGDKGLKYYPKSKDMEVRKDSMLNSAQIERIIPTENENYLVKCSNGISFGVKGNSEYKNGEEVWEWTITSSSNLYPFEEKLKLIGERENKAFEEQRPSTDLQCAKRIKQIEAEIEAEKERQRQEAYVKERKAYWEKIGLAITSIRMTSGRDKDGDKTKGLSFRVFNPTQRSIKYVIADIYAVNRVGDRMSYNKRCRGIGPIEPQESGEYEFEDIFVDRNDVIDNLSVSFQVVFMNGGSKNIRLKDALTNNNNFQISWWY